MKCPKPLYELQKFLKNNSQCSTFKVFCDDKNAIGDFKSFEDFGVIKINSTNKKDNVIIFEITRAQQNV